MTLNLTSICFFRCQCKTMFLCYAVLLLSPQTWKLRKFSGNSMQPERKIVSTKWCNKMRFPGCRNAL